MRRPQQTKPSKSGLVPLDIKPDRLLDNLGRETVAAKADLGHHQWLRLKSRNGKPTDNVTTPFQRLMADNGVTCSMSRSGNVWDNAAMESFFSSLKTEPTARKTYRSRDHARADVFDYIERFYNAIRRHSTLGYLSPVEFEKQAQLA
jgi:putative transposase